MQTVHLISDSRGYDAALISLADAATVCAKLRKWLIVGGHMVNLHILRAGLPLPLRQQAPLRPPRPHLPFRCRRPRPRSRRPMRPRPTER